MEQLVNGRYRIGKKLGQGAFGRTHLGTDVHTQEQVAIKFESRRMPYSLLYIESNVYSHLQECGRFPKVRWYGPAGQCYALVMDLLGPNLEKLLKKCGGKFSLKTVLMLAAQMLKLIEYVHSKSHIHRDIKPDNFTMGLGKKASQVFMIDFGIAEQYRDPTTHEHIPYGDGMRIIGTAVYASINSHDGIELSRRDDLESLGYVLVYFLRGSLPWMSIAANSAPAYFRKVRDKKVSTSIEDLCDGCPSEFKSYFRYVHGLRFDEAPDYAFLDSLFRKAFASNGYRYDFLFDWMPKPVKSDRRGTSSEVPSTQNAANKFKQKSSVPGNCNCKCNHKRNALTKFKLGKAVKGFFRGL